MGFMEEGSDFGITPGRNQWLDIPLGRWYVQYRP